MQTLANGQTSFLVVEVKEWLANLRMTIENLGHQLRTKTIVEIRFPHYLTKPRKQLQNTSCKQIIKQLNTSLGKNHT
jgi:hypothetical protein